MRLTTPLRLARHAAHRLSPTEREVLRLIESPRYVAGRSNLLGPTISYVDGPSFGWQYRSIFEGHAYRLPDLLAPRIIDCGANIGTAILYWKQHHPDARITAYEADPAVADVLRDNLQAAGHADVEVIQAAVWDANGEVAFIGEGADAGRVDSTGTPVQAIRLRDTLTGRIDLLKLDIEGAEATVLVDCASSLREVQRIFVEFHSFVGRPQRFDEVVSVLADAGFRFHFRSEMSSPSPFVERGTYGNMDAQLNLYAFRC